MQQTTGTLTGMNATQYWAGNQRGEAMIDFCTSLSTPEVLGGARQTVTTQRLVVQGHPAICLAEAHALRPVAIGMPQASVLASEYVELVTSLAVCALIFGGEMCTEMHTG